MNMNVDSASNAASQPDDPGMAIMLLLALLIVLLFVFRNHGKDRMKNKATGAGLKNPPSDAPVVIPEEDLLSEAINAQTSLKTGSQNFEDSGITEPLVYDKSNAEVLARIDQRESEDKATVGEMTNANVLAKINHLGTKKQSISVAFATLVISAVLFVLLGAYRWSLEFVILLAIAIFIHECGHLLAMKIYGYKNLKMLFIPLFGGVASGEPNEHDSFKMAMISLAGPLVGLLAGIFASFVGGVVAGVASKVTPFVRLALLFTTISFALNVFNLLPFVPLDGGNFLNETFFARFPKTELGLKILGIIGLAYLAFNHGGVLLGVVAFFMALVLQPTYKVSTMIMRLRKDEGFRVGSLDEEKIGRIRSELKKANPFYESPRNIKGLPQVVKGIWNKVQKKFPSPKATVILLALYLVVTVGLIYLSVASVHKYQRNPPHPLYAPRQ